ELGVLLTQTVGEYEEKLKSNGLDLILKKPENEVFIMADGRLLWRVFDNLMNNISKYAQPSTRAYLNLDIEGKQAVITFRNISKFSLNISSDELLDRFIRGDSSRNTEGSGLGLSIAKSLTELQHGTLDLFVDGDLFKIVVKFDIL
ncbi:MAG: sensor histidine kinase, partial [Clostridiaceae bacterium]|nr:sensor histidine kinase [Clostridiaceae bacterium]